MEVPYGEVERLMQRAGPALLRLPGDGESGFLALLGGGHRMVSVLGPDRVVYRLRAAAICAALCRAAGSSWACSGSRPPSSPVTAHRPRSPSAWVACSWPTGPSTSWRRGCGIWPAPRSLGNRSRRSSRWQPAPRWAAHRRSPSHPCPAPAAPMAPPPCSRRTTSSSATRTAARPSWGVQPMDPRRRPAPARRALRRRQIHHGLPAQRLTRARVRSPAPPGARPTDPGHRGLATVRGRRAPVPRKPRAHRNLRL
jgi:hypothetical protein